VDENEARRLDSDFSGSQKKDFQKRRAHGFGGGIGT
jgi:hypothetical protein